MQTNTKLGEVFCKIMVIIAFILMTNIQLDYFADVLHSTEWRG